MTTDPHQSARETEETFGRRPSFQELLSTLSPLDIPPRGFYRYRNLPPNVLPPDAVRPAIHFKFSDIIRHAIRCERFKKGIFIRYRGIFQCRDGIFAKHMLKIFLTSPVFKVREKRVFEACLLAIERNLYNSTLVAVMRRIFRVPPKKAPFRGRKPFRELVEVFKRYGLGNHDPCLSETARSHPQILLDELPSFELADDEQSCFELSHDEQPPVEQVVTEELNQFSIDDYPPIVPVAVVFEPMVDYSTVSWDDSEGENQPDSNLPTPPPSPRSPPEPNQSALTTPNTEARDIIPPSGGEVSSNEPARNSPETSDSTLLTEEEQPNQPNSTNRSTPTPEQDESVSTSPHTEQQDNIRTTGGETSSNEPARNDPGEERSASPSQNRETQDDTATSQDELNSNEPPRSTSQTGDPTPSELELSASITHNTETVDEEVLASEGELSNNEPALDTPEAGDAILSEHEEQPDQSDSTNLPATPPEEGQCASTGLLTPPPDPDLQPEQDQSASTTHSTETQAAEEQSASITHNTETHEDVPVSIGQQSIDDSARNSPEPGDRDAETAGDDADQLTHAREGGCQHNSGGSDAGNSRSPSGDRSRDNVDRSAHSPVEEDDA